MSSPRRPPRDPYAPKRNMSAYLLYENAMRETFKMQVRFSLLLPLTFVHMMCL